MVKAGLIPALWRGDLPGSENWYIVDMLPGHRPLDELEVALLRVSGTHDLNLREQLDRDEHGLARVANLILPDDSSELLIVIDQFEEVFTLLDNEDERLHYLNLLRKAVINERSRVRIIVTLRADYYDKPLQYPDIGELMRSRIETILPLSADELERAISHPAQRVGIGFEDGLVSRIVSDVHYQPGALPLLQYALTELFERRNERTLSLEAYEEIGGTGGALAKRADEIYQEQDDTGREHIRQLFLRLVMLGEGAEDTRRRVTRAELLAITPEPERMNELIDLFAASRLLSFDHDPASRQPIVEVAHEAILREWERLRHWLNESREDIRQERSIGQAAGAWQANKRDGSYLLTGTRLEQAEIWQEITDLALTPLEKQYIQASIQEARMQKLAEAERQDREAAQEQRSRTLLRALVGVFAVAALVAGGLALVANTQRLRAEDSEQEALRQASIGLAAQAVSELASDTPDRGVLLALEALEHYPYTPQAESALAQTVRATRPYHDLIGSGGTVAAVAFSANGRVAAASDLYDALIWDPASNQSQIIGSTYPPLSRIGYVDLDWSPDGTHLVTVSASFADMTAEVGTIRVWDTSQQELIKAWTGHDGENIWTVDWSNNGQFIVTGGADSLLRLWDAHSYEQSQSFSGHSDTILDVNISPDDSRLASASSDMTIRIWDTQTGETERVLSGHLGAVNAVSWSPDGSKIVSAANDGLVIVWDAISGDILQTFAGHSASVLDADWSPDGTLIATASEDGTTQVWDPLTGSVISNFVGSAHTLAWSPDGKTLVVGFGISSLRAWDMSQRPLRLTGHESDILDAHWTPDGTHIVTGSFDGTARVWDVATGENTLVYRGHITEDGPAVAGEVHISADSQWAVTHGGDNNTRVLEYRNR